MRLCHRRRRCRRYQATMVIRENPYEGATQYYENLVNRFGRRPITCVPPRLNNVAVVFFFFFFLLLSATTGLGRRSLS